MRHITLWAAGYLAVIGSAEPLQGPDAGGFSVQGNQGSAVSADRLYREYRDNPLDAQSRYSGQAITVSGTRGEVRVDLVNGGASVQLAAGGHPGAIIADFDDAQELKGSRLGGRFVMRCAVRKYEYGSVWLEFCRVARQPAAGSSGVTLSAIPSANVVYREYQANAPAARRKYDGKELTLNGVKGEVITLQDGDFAVHIPDFANQRALIATFSERLDLDSIRPRQRFSFRCRVGKYEYNTVWLEACRVAH